jgi:hypothetical protein
LRLQQRNVLDYLSQACLAKRNNLGSSGTAVEALDIVFK